MSREFEVLCCVARRQLETARVERLRCLVGEGVDWGRLEHLGRAHGLLPLLHWQTTVNGIEVSGEFREVVRGEFGLVSRRNRLLAGEATRLMRALAAVGVDVLAYKGPVAAVMAYGNLALRPFSDIDLLVRLEDLDAAREVMEKRGYVVESHLGSARADAEHVLKLARDDGASTVELHWALAPGYYRCALGFEAIWSRRTTVSLGGMEVPTLSVSDTVLALCLHGLRHNWFRLEWVSGVWMLVEQHPGLDWGELSERARASGLERVLRIGLLLGETLLGTAKLTGLDGWLRGDRVAVEVADMLCGWIATGETGRFWQRRGVGWRARERWAEKLAYGWHLAGSLVRTGGAGC